MPEHQPGSWFPRKTLAISPVALQALLEERHREDDLRLARDLQAAVHRLDRVDALVARVREVTDPFALGRLLLDEAVAMLGFRAGLVALVGDEAFLEVLASSTALVPPYRIELVEEAFIAGEPLRIAGGDGLSSVGNADVPPDTELIVEPFEGLDGAPLGVLLLEGAPAPERAAWVEGFTALAARALAECRRYNQVEALLFDAAIAVASSKPSGQSPSGQAGGQLRTLCCGTAAALGLGESDVRRAGFLATLHVLGPEALAEGMRQLRHGQETGKRWREARSAQARWEIYDSPVEAWEGLFLALAAPGGAERVGLRRLTAILRVALAFQQALAAIPKHEAQRPAKALARARDRLAHQGPDGEALLALARYLGLA
ncbi:MAG: hypothetical protein VKQ33_05140 [Candidatus Sericytochromatia bacterium]|nr:hypothetical protein [Candidatus Sericytochromatia bacterium]